MSGLVLMNLALSEHVYVRVCVLDKIRANECILLRSAIPVALCTLISVQKFEMVAFAYINDSILCKVM